MKKQTKMKKENLLQKYIHHIKTMVYNWLSKSVKKEKPRHAFDYERHSWFNPKYFKHKLKRKIMGIIYEMYTSIEKSMLETYFIEYDFTTIPSQTLEKVNKERVRLGYSELKGDYKGYLPLIAKVRSFKDASMLASNIQDYFREQGCIQYEGEMGDVTILKLKKERDVEIAIKKANNKLKGKIYGRLIIKTRTPKKENLRIDVESYSERVENYDIGLIKQHSDLTKQDFEYTLIITKDSTEV